MTKRRKVVYEDDDKPHPTASFTWGTLVSWGIIPLLTAAVVFIAQWAVSGDTLKRHEKSIEAIVTSREDEKRARETVRNEFMASQTKLVEVLARLDTRLSVSEKQQEASGRQIEKISDFLQRVPSQEKRR